MHDVQLHPDSMRAAAYQGSQGSTRYTGTREKVRTAGAGFATRSYAARGVAAEPAQQPVLRAPRSLSARASSQQLASRIVGYTRPPGDDAVRKSLMDMLSSDWSSSASATPVGQSRRRRPAGTAPRPGAGAGAAAPRPQSLPPLTAPATGGRTAVTAGPNSANPSHWSGGSRMRPIPSVMGTTQPFASEPRHQATKTYALGPGNIDTQVAAIAEHIRAARFPDGEANRAGGVNLAPLSPTRRPAPPSRALGATKFVSPGSESTGPIVSSQRRPTGKPRVAETSEDRARAAVCALKNRYTARIGTAGVNTQVVGKSDPGWSAAEIRRYSTSPLREGLTGDGQQQKRAAKPSPSPTKEDQPPPRRPARTPKRTAAPAGTSSGYGQKPESFAPRAVAETPPGEPKIGPTVSARRPQPAYVPLRVAPAPTSVVGKRAEPADRFAGFVDHDMDEEDGLTGWGSMDD